MLPHTHPDAEHAERIEVSSISNETRSHTMHNWEYLFVFAAITSEGGEFRPRFANDQELDDWQKGPTMYDYANRLGASGWELFSCHPIVFTQSNWQPSLEPQPISSDLRAIEMVFKRPKNEADDFPCEPNAHCKCRSQDKVL
jgi:hypothetical protein